ncbi:hypothetical protein LCGC14_0958320 [marine sediment metagenome]|uniref:Uncharacterized protein n=1 Tax=marine sediment metagenome TaxID=412755 RepID=A0A0F9QYI8_9ZZZZ
MADRIKKAIDVVAGNDALAAEYNDLRTDVNVALSFVAAEQDTPDLTLMVSQGTVIINGITVKFAGGNSGSFTAPSVNPRVDLLSIDSAGVLNITTGVEAASPVVPDYPTDEFVIAEVFNRVGQTTVLNETVAGEGFIQLDARPHTLDASGGADVIFDEGETLAVGDPVGISAADAVKKAFVTSGASVGTAEEIFNGGIAADSIPIEAGGGVHANVCTIDPVTGAVTVGAQQNNIGADTAINRVALCKLDTNKFAIVYANSTTNTVRMRACTVSGTTITLGAEVTRASVTGNVLAVRCAQLGTDKFAWIMTNSINNDMHVQANTVATTTITQGSLTDTGEDTPTTSELNFDIWQVTTDKGAFAFDVLSPANDGKCVVFTLSGTTFTFGTGVVFETGVTTRIRGNSPTTTSLAIFYEVSSSGQLIAATISGTVPTFGSKLAVSTDAGGVGDVTTIKSGTVGICYKKSSVAKVASAEVTGNILSGLGSAIPETTFDSGNITQFELADMGSTTAIFVVGYKRTTNRPFAITILPTKTPTNVVGVVKQLLSGSRVSVRISGVDANQSGMTVGVKQYVDEGVLVEDAGVTNGADSFIGLAKSATEVVVGTGQPD